MSKVSQVRAVRDKATLAAFFVMVAGIGGNVIAIKYIARAGDLDPAWAAASRFLLATAPLNSSACLSAPASRSRNSQPPDAFYLLTGVVPFRQGGTSV